MIKIKENNKPILKVCEMICDTGLHPKLNEYDIMKFHNEHFTSLFIGKPGSGKTNLLYSFMKSPKLFRKIWHNIFLFQPSHSRVSMKDKLFDDLPEDQKFEELNDENLNYVMETIKSEDAKYNNCIIFDDMGAYLKDPLIMKTLKELIFNRRHYRTSIIFLCQTWYSVPKDIRKLFSNIFCFKCAKQELKVLFDEVIEGKEKYINDISKLVFSEPYKWLFINTNSQRLFDGFDEIVIEDE